MAILLCTDYMLISVANSILLLEEGITFVLKFQDQNILRTDFEGLDLKYYYKALRPIS